MTGIREPLYGAAADRIRDQLRDARDLRNLLAAVREALTLPFDTADYDRRLVERAAWARTVADAVLDQPGEDIGWNADYLRGKLTALDAENRDGGEAR